MIESEYLQFDSRIRGSITYSERYSGVCCNYFGIVFRDFDIDFIVDVFHILFISFNVLDSIPIRIDW